MDREVALALADLLAQIALPLMLEPEDSHAGQSAARLSEVIDDLREVARARNSLDEVPRGRAWAARFGICDHAYAVALDRLQVEHKRKY